MADSKITALASIGTGTDPANDPLVIVDVSDVSPSGMSATGTTKKVTLNNLLACSPTATLASATITGDLTVRTTGLTVNSSGVGVGLTAALGAGNIQIAAGKYLGYSASAYITPEDNVQGARIKANAVLIDATSTAGFNIGGSTAMTLNSTGLGVGTSPANDKILSLGSMGILLSGTTSDFNFRNSGSTAIQRLRYTDATGTLTIGSATGTAYPVELGGNTTTRAVTIDASGNLLVGTTSASSLIGGSGAITAKGIAGILSVNVTALSTNFTLPIGAFSGILVIRSNGGGGSAVWMLDPNAGAVSISNNIVGRTITFTFSGGAWQLQQTVGTVPSLYNYNVIATQ